MSRKTSSASARASPVTQPGLSKPSALCLGFEADARTSCALFVILLTGTEARRQRLPVAVLSVRFAHSVVRAVQAGVAASMSGSGYALLCLL